MGHAGLGASSFLLLCCRFRQSTVMHLPLTSYEYLDLIFPSVCILFPPCLHFVEFLSGFCCILHFIAYCLGIYCSSLTLPRYSCSFPLSTVIQSLFAPASYAALLLTISYKELPRKRQRTRLYRKLHCAIRGPRTAKKSKIVTSSDTQQSLSVPKHKNAKPCRYLELLEPSKLMLGAMDLEEALVGRV